METDQEDKQFGKIEFSIVGFLSLSTVWDAHGLDPASIQKHLQEADKSRPWVKRGCQEAPPIVGEAVWDDYKRPSFSITPQHWISETQIHAFYSYLRNLAAGLAESPTIPPCVSRVGYWIEVRSEQTEFFTKAGDRRYSDLRTSHWA